MSYSVDCRVSISFLGVRNHANGDSEAGGPRRKLLVIATLRLKGTAAVGGWYSTAGGGVVMCSTINQKVELYYFFVRGAAEKIRESRANQRSMIAVG